MPDNKDFLSQFSNEGKPASFQEEERIPVVKEKKPINVKLIAILAVVLLALGILAYFLFFAPKIEMPNFVGKTKADVAAWVKQQGIEASGIIFEEEYNFDYDEGQILTQSVKDGKKVKKNVKINFTQSLGPDPAERISVPNIETMDKEDIQNWINDNKLAKTRIMTAFNDEIPEGSVIDYSFSGCEEDSFTRGCTLKINVSKGAAPAGTVQVEDFEKKPFETVEAWAKSKKIVLNKTETYNDKVESGYVISQSIGSGKTMKEGETLTVVVSKGKAIYMPNMVGWTKKQVDAWVRKNSSVYIDMEKGLYSSKAKDIILSQSLAAGSLIDPAELIELTVSLGNIVDVPGTFIGTEYHDRDGLHDWKDAQNYLGADIKVNRIKDFSDDHPVGTIFKYDNGVYVGGTLNVYVSRGRNVLLEDFEDKDGKKITWADFAECKLTEEEARTLCDSQKITYEISYANDEAQKESGKMISVRRWDDRPIAVGTYLPQDITVYIVICDKSY